jgi:hypothetical protein
MSDAKAAGVALMDRPGSTSAHRLLIYWWHDKIKHTQPLSGWQARDDSGMSGYRSLGSFGGGSAVAIVRRLEPGQMWWGR